MECDLTDFKIIVIDDNPAIHHDFIKILTSAGSSPLDELSVKMFGKQSNEDNLLPNFQIATASQGQEGVEHIKEALNKGSPYSLAFVDIRMPPGWDGIETIKHIWNLDKDIQIVICTAYSDYSWEETVAHLGKTDNLLILKKPFDNISVRQLACALTKKWQLLQDTRKFTSSLKQQVDDRTVSLQKSLSLVKATLESSDEGIVVLSNEGAIIDYNQKLLSLWNLPQSIMDYKDEKQLFNFMKNKLINPDQFSNWLQQLHQDQNTINIDVIKFIDGKVFDCYAQSQLIEGKIVGRVLNFRDITSRTLLENKLQYQATHDALTGLPNRVLLLEKMHVAMKQADISGTQSAIMFLDLDRFKLINDSLSHATGDELLRLTAKRLQSSLEDEDTLARLGGDEFVIVINNANDDLTVKTKAQKIVDALHAPFRLDDRDVVISASVGVSLYPKDAKTSDVLLQNADAAMYHAKELGSNNFQLFTDVMHEKSLEKLDQEIMLRDALHSNQLELWYQPQFDLGNEKLTAVEALIRWRHPTKGLLLPIDFIPLAEETGLIVTIGEWVIQTACKQNKLWQDSGLPPIRVAVNISLQQLKQQNLYSVIKHILTETGLKPEYLELELTENIIISNTEVIAAVTKLKELGVTIAIDDFGTGYSSLSFLKKLPLDRLKIDKAFIQNIQSATDDEVLIRAIISVAKYLNLEVLAEGVETQNQLNFLKNQKCNEIQGYFYSRPLTHDDLEKLLKDPSKLEMMLPTEK